MLNFSFFLFIVLFNSVQYPTLVIIYLMILKTLFSIIQQLNSTTTTTVRLQPQSYINTALKHLKQQQKKELSSWRVKKVRDEFTFVANLQQITKNKGYFS